VSESDDVSVNNLHLKSCTGALLEGRKTGTLESQAEIGVWVQAPWAVARVQGYGVWPPEKIFEIVLAKFCDQVHFWQENGSQWRL